MNCCIGGVAKPTPPQGGVFINSYLLNMTEQKGKTPDLGYSDVKAFRETNQYVETEELFRQLGLTTEVENRTPPVAVNIAHLARMDSVQRLSIDVEGRDLCVTILGLSSAQGPKDFERLLKGLGAGFIKTTVVDISDGIFDDVKKSGLDEVSCIQTDARNSGIETESQDFILRDHIGNCCPPEVDRIISMEASRILRYGGISILNITTSELLALSLNRGIVTFKRLSELVGADVISGLRQHVYDLNDLKETFPRQEDIDLFRGFLIEIEEGGSFVVFGEDLQGHGEWFRAIREHILFATQHGMELKEMKSRIGWDSHTPPLKCFRHNIIFEKRRQI